MQIVFGQQDEFQQAPASDLAMNVEPTVVGQQRRSPGRQWRLWLLVAAIILAILVGGGLWRWRSERIAARSLLARGRLAEARAKLARLLWLRPGDSGLRLMIAETYARDDSLPDATRAAVECLRQIPDDVPEGLEARIREARLRLLLLYQPAQAESLLNRALKIAPDSIDALRLKWTILDLTGRADYVEPVFLQVYRLGPAPSRCECLRAWYDSQIEPSRASAGLDDQMGFRNSPDETERRVELHRLLAFRTQEPDHPGAHAALARWFQEEGDLRQALRVLEEGPPIAQVHLDPFFLATTVSVLVAAGRLEQAAAAFAQWPPPHEGYDYWRSEGLLHEEAERDYLAAANSYDKALAIWPGPADWKCRFRQAACLALAGDEQRAEECRRTASLVRDLFKPKALHFVRQAMETPEEKSSLDPIVEFYRSLNRDIEVRYWKEAVED
jgi:tetratricopeptide (TPR) repeat protein